jgi:hypothetical protein
MTRRKRENNDLQHNGQKTKGVTRTQLNTEAGLLVPPPLVVSVPCRHQLFLQLSFLIFFSYAENPYGKCHLKKFSNVVLLHGGLFLIYIQKYYSLLLDNVN